MLKIGDRVTHVDYPQLKGTIVGRCRNYELRQHIYEVLWSPRVQKKSTSRHIGSALKRVQ